MSFSRTFILYIFIIICVFSSFSSEQQNETEFPAYCLQKRPEKIDNILECNQFQDIKDFCGTIQCEPVDEKTCEQNEDTAIVQNITGRGCCPACVKYIDEDGLCEVRSKLKRCRNGLFCNPSTKKCNLPPVSKRCMREVHNRRLVQQESRSFYLQGIKDFKPVYFEIKYARVIEHPTCAAQSGEYEPKQCRGSKCFCVEPKTGKASFGLTLKDSYDSSAENVTCECTEQFRQKFSTDNLNKDRIQMEHFSQVHAKCDSAGNFEKLQCINATCFCVDEKTGQPTMDRVASYGALSTLPCFDEDRAKALGGKEADTYYQNTCEKQLMQTQRISLHFMDKGTDLIGLDKIACSYDGKFAPKQCKPGRCECVTPDEGDIRMPMTFGVDRMTGNDFAMDCQCARQTFYANMEQKGYDRPQCEGSGNFKAYQAFENGLKTFCVDENGSRITEMTSGYCYDQFAKEIYPEVANLREDVCKSMRQILTDTNMDKDSYYKFDKEQKYIPLSGKPPDTQLYCNIALTDQCKCPQAHNM